VSIVTNLGVSYNNQFSFRPHINSIVSKDSFRAKLIITCFVTRDYDTLCKAFCASVHPVLEFLMKYGILILRWIFKQETHQKMR